MGNKTLKHLSIFFIFFLLIFEAFPQSVLFNKIYAKPNGIDLEAVAAYQLESGNYFGIGRHDGGSYFIRLDSLGNKTWELIKNDDCKIYYSILRENKNYLIAGVNAQNKIFFKEIDSAGNEIWTNFTQFDFIQGSRTDLGGLVKLKESQNQTINALINGISGMDGLGPSYFLSLDATGVIVDSTELYDYYGGFTPALDSGFVLVGSKQDSNPSGSSNFLITKLNPNGDSVWSKLYNSNYTTINPCFGVSIICLDSSYLVGANDGNVFEVYNFPGVLLHFDLNGDTAGSYHQMDFPRHVDPISYLYKTKNSDIILGSSIIYCDNPGDCWEYGSKSFIHYYDSELSLTWTDEVTPSWYGTQNIQEKENGFIGFGNTHIFIAIPTIPPPGDYYRLNLWNYDSLGNSISSLNHSLEEKQNISVFPNPAIDQLHFAFSPAMFQSANVDVFSLQGDLMIGSSLNEESFSINVSGLNPGIYIYKIQSDKRNSIGKFIKQ